MEIEKKFLVHLSNIELNNYEYRIIEQGYLSTSPVVRVRRDNDDYYLTYKSSGLMVRQEVNLPLTKESYMHLIKKSDGNVISKRRYLIPYQYVPGNSSPPAFLSPLPYVRIPCILGGNPHRHAEFPTPGFRKDVAFLISQYRLLHTPYHCRSPLPHLM